VEFLVFETLNVIKIVILDIWSWNLG